MRTTPARRRTWRAFSSLTDSLRELLSSSLPAPATNWRHRHHRRCRCRPTPWHLALEQGQNWPRGHRAHHEKKCRRGTNHRERQSSHKPKPPHSHPCCCRGHRASHPLPNKSRRVTGSRGTGTRPGGTARGGRSSRTTAAAVRGATRRHLADARGEPKTCYRETAGDKRKTGGQTTKKKENQQTSRREPRAKTAAVRRECWYEEKVREREEGK